VKALKAVVLSAILTLASVTAEAYPILQLDIIGGHYDASTATVVSDGADFTLVALLTRSGNRTTQELLADTYYISAAVSPNPGAGATGLGSFTWNATNYDVTGDMTYGTPPLDVDSGANLPSHGIFPTFFSEFGFQFNEANRVASYNVEDNPGNPLTPTSATSDISYFATFNVTTALIGTNVLHFDLYNTVLRDCRRNQSCGTELNLDLNAPFSHDAESSNNKVAEPGSLLLMSVGLLFAARSLSRLKKTR
jgi:hypothetical protein